MAQWLKKNLGDAILARDEQEKLKAYLEKAYDSAGNQADMASFYRHESEGRLHCEVIVYLSPSSRAIVSGINASPCKKPAPHSLSLLAGSVEAWRIHFPEQRKV